MSSVLVHRSNVSALLANILNKSSCGSSASRMPVLRKCSVAILVWSPAGVELCASTTFISKMLSRGGLSVRWSKLPLVVSVATCLEMPTRKKASSVCCFVTKPSSSGTRSPLRHSALNAGQMITFQSSGQVRFLGKMILRKLGSPFGLTHSGCKVHCSSRVFHATAWQSGLFSHRAMQSGYRSVERTSESRPHLPTTPSVVMGLSGPSGPSPRGGRGPCSWRS
mmetsp:Transcript_33917/g.74431  ORF Transcript_33917/g.74431 Transcript_33917/m.74431 type:complete len:223 (-) Transcript_33917:251-919(-)